MNTKRSFKNNDNDDSVVTIYQALSYARHCPKYFINFMKQRLFRPIYTTENKHKDRAKHCQSWTSNAGRVDSNKTVLLNTILTDVMAPMEQFKYEKAKNIAWQHGYYQQLTENLQKAVFPKTRVKDTQQRDY